jgi:hypothetical protein
MTRRLNIGARSCDCTPTGQPALMKRGGIATAPKARKHIGGRGAALRHQF